MSNAIAYKAIAEGLSLVEMSGVYNDITDSSIKKFRNKATGVKRLVKVFEEEKLDPASILKIVHSHVDKDRVLDDGAFVGIKKAKPAALPGPKNKHSGKKIYIKVKENPRRKGTQGYKSWEILQKLGSGVLFDTYINKKGRTQDINWDLGKGWIEVK